MIVWNEMNELSVMNAYKTLTAARFVYSWIRKRENVDIVRFGLSLLQ